MATLVDVGGGQKLRSLFAKLEERIPEEALRPTAMKIAQDVAKRAPTPDQEFVTMMYGGFNMSGAATSKRGQEDDDGRIRFEKPRENYLKNYLPASFGVSGLYAGIGDIEMLNQISAYMYVNKNRDGTHEHLVTEPFWYAWEFGGVFRVVPKDYGPKRGRGHPLLPTADSKTWEMIKTIPARFMFTGTDIGAFVDSTLIPGVKRIVKSL